MKKKYKLIIKTTRKLDEEEYKDYKFVMDNQKVVIDWDQLEKTGHFVFKHSMREDEDVVSEYILEEIK